MYNFIPLALALISLAVIIIIVARKFPALAALDVDTIQEEKEAKMKEQIIGSRIKRNVFRWSSKASRWMVPALQFIKDALVKLFNKLIDIKDVYRKEKTIEELTPEAKEQATETLVEEADELIRKDEYEAAEKRLIEAIGLDPKNMEAFESLADLYFQRKDYNEARQTYEHILKLCENVSTSELFLAGCYQSLAEVCEAMDNMDGAQESAKKALQLEPNNPRHLDSLLRISIIRKDKIEAMDALERLREVNPENKKIEEYSRQISEL